MLRCAGKASLFTFSSNNAMVQLVSRGGPRILQNQVNQQVAEHSCLMTYLASDNSDTPRLNKPANSRGCNSKLAQAAMHL